jgi:mono/diheme cytochrome c family protein
MFRKIILALLVIVVVAFVACVVFVASRQNLKFDTPYPEVAASTDSLVVTRGHYLVRSVVNCAGCHGDTSSTAQELAGEDIALSGGYVFDIPPGKIYARNITPDPETGLGNVTPQAIARALREGVGLDGRALLPFMEMQGLADDDLAAVVSYLKSMPPVHNPVPMHQYTLLGKVIKATAFSKPVGPKEPPLKAAPHGATIENGRYLVESVALCGSCHTQRNMMTGAFTGPHLGGATGFDATATLSWSPPNITSDPTTGRLGNMTEDEFVTRFRAGRLLEGSPMPWQGFSRMDEQDLRAIYLYLKSLPPVVHDVGLPVVTVKKK